MNQVIKNEILSHISRGNDKEAIELLLKEIPGGQKEEAILHSARLHDIQKTNKN